MKAVRVLYIISDVDKALAFEWIAERLNKDQFDLSFVLLNTGDSALQTYLMQSGISCERITCRSKRDWPKVIVQLYKYLKLQKPDIVHCHLFTASILGLTAAKLAGVPQLIYTRHHSDFHFRYFPKGVKWDKWCNRLADKIIAPSGTVQQVLCKMEGVPEEKVIVIHHGFDLNYFRHVDPVQAGRLKERYNHAGFSPVIGVIARFTELKGIQYIIPAFKQLLMDFPDAKLLLFNAGGDYEKEIRALLQGIPAEHYETIRFEAELAAVYSLFDVFVQASVDTQIESFGQTYVEALAAGIPSVFTLAGIANDFIKDGTNAVVVPFKDSAAIYAGIKKILNNKEWAEKLVQKGIQITTQLFSIDQMLPQLEELYLQLSEKNA